MAAPTKEEFTEVLTWIESIMKVLKKLTKKVRNMARRARPGGVRPTPPEAPPEPPSFTEQTASVDSSTILANPGVGLQTTQATLTTASNPRGTPIRNMTYRRHCSEVEATEGVRDFATTDRIWDEALAWRQKVNSRIIWGEPDVGVPSWVTSYGGYTATCSDNGDSSMDRYPDWANSSVKTAFANQLAAWVAKYGDHPANGFHDSCAIGLYGEGHWSGTTIVSKLGGAPGTVGQPIPMIGTSDINVHLDAHRDAFSTTTYHCPANVDTTAIWNATAGRARFGARADGIAYRPSVGSPGVQMGTLYPPTVMASTSWQVGPYCGEIYSSFSSWISNGWDYASSLAWCSTYHFCVLNTKGLSYNALLNSSIDSMLLAMGYRLTCTKVRHQTSIGSGNPISLGTWWSNTGNSPLYFPYVLAIQLTSLADGSKYRIATSRSLALFLPGTTNYTDEVTIPTWVPGGNYTLSIALLDSSRMVPEIDLAQSGQDASGWYPFTTLQVTSNEVTANPNAPRWALFDGSDYLSMSGSIDAVKASGHDYSFSIRGMIAGSLGTTQAIFSKGDLGSTGMEYAFYHSGSTGKLTFRVSNSSTLYLVQADTYGATQAGVPFTAYCEIDNTAKTIKLSINGGALDSASFTGTVRSGTNEFRIGADTTGRNLLSGSKVKDFRKYFRKLTSPEQATVATNPDYESQTLSIRYGLQMAHDMDETSGQRNDNHGIRHLTDNSSVGSIAA